MYPADSEAVRAILHIGKKMAQGRFVTANDGNITARVGEDAVWATPTGVNKGDLSPDKLIKLRISDGRILEGTWKPTSEMDMHLSIYRTDDRIMSTAHAHPVNLTALACAGITLDLPTTPAACCLSGVVPVIPYRCSGSRELAASVIPYVKDYHVVNLGNHGPIAWGENLMEAWFRLEDAEASAEIALKLLSLGRLRPLSKPQVEALLAFHHISMPAAARMDQYPETDNQREALLFSDLMRGSAENA